MNPSESWRHKATTGLKTKERQALAGEDRMRVLAYLEQTKPDTGKRNSAGTVHESVRRSAGKNM